MGLESSAAPRQAFSIAGARFGLSSQTLRALSKPNLSQSICAISLIWLPVGLAVLLCELSNLSIVYFLSLFVIASRQHGCMILMHEGTHFRLASSRIVNEILSDLFAALPIFMSTEIYRRNHLRHHAFLCTDSDPDWVRKYKDADWKFPKTKAELLRTWLTYLYGRGIAEMLRMWRHLLGLSKVSLSDKSLRTRFFAYGLFYLSLVGMLTFFQLWVFYFWYWVVPSLTVLPLIMRLRSIAEHFGLEYSNELNSSRNVLCGPIEAFFISPFNVNLHLNHHLFPSVPFHKLKQLQKELSRDRGFRVHAHTNSSYLFSLRTSVLSDLLAPEAVAFRTSEKTTL
jgi:fatty acid desaturase